MKLGSCPITIKPSPKNFAAIKLPSSPSEMESVAPKERNAEDWVSERIRDVNGLRLIQYESGRTKSAYGLGQCRSLYGHGCRFIDDAGEANEGSIQNR